MQIQAKNWRFGVSARDITTTFNAWSFSFTEREKEVLYLTKNDIPVDEENRIRIDDWEMDSEVQKEVYTLMPQVNSENAASLVDLEGYRHDFLATSGFDIEGVDYDADILRFDTI